MVTVAWDGAIASVVQVGDVGEEIGEIVAVGEAYDTLAAAKEGCAAVQRAAEGANVVEADN